LKLHEVTTSQLKTLWETHKTTVKQDTAIHIHRAFSWLGRAEACHKNDSDIALLCRWAGFNAIYAQWDIDERSTISDKFSWQHFASRILELDEDKHVAFVIRRQERRINEMFASKYLNSRNWRKHEIPNHQERDQSVND